MSAELWQTVLSVVANTPIEVRSLRTSNETDLLVLTSRLPADLEKVYQLKPENVSGAFRYEMTESMYWSLVRAAANICIHRQDVAVLRQMALAIMDDDFNGLLSHILRAVGLEAKFNGMHALDDKIIFHRKILWAKAEDTEIDQDIVPGLTYCYRPKDRSTSLQITYSCQMLWNWLLGIKYTRVNQLLSMASFKQLEALFAHANKEEVNVA